MPGPLDFLNEDPKKIHSWRYWATHRTFAVHWLTLKIAGAFTLFSAILVVATNPNIPLNWGWNTIEHISDPVPFHDYARNGAIAMTRSDPWLGLATPSDGLVIVSSNARVPVSSTGIDAVDITNGPEDGSFYSLDSSHGVTLTRRKAWQWWNTDWLETPDSPVWKLNTSRSETPVSDLSKPEHDIDPDDVLYSELDETGLLLGVRGRGIARNTFVGSGGKFYRTRNWQQSDPFSSIDLSQIIGTAKGYWLAMSSGDIRFAERATLTEISERTAKTGGVRQFSAAKNGDWATMVDIKGAARFFTEQSGWNGPWFERDSKALSSVYSVTAARLMGSDLWLGASNGLYVYDTMRREFRTILGDSAVVSLETIGDGVLAGTSSGLYFVGRSGDPKLLDDVSPLGLQLSPSGDTTVYRGRDQETGELSVRAIADPASGGPAIFAVTGWRSSASEPALRGVLQRGEFPLFVTTAGCFIYKTRGSPWPTYQDCSTAVSHDSPDQRKFQVNSFEWISQEDGAVLAFADGKSLILNDDNAWLVIDPDNETALHRLTAVSGQVYALGTQAQVIRFDRNHGEPEEPIYGSKASWLDDGNGPFRGDLIGDAKQWRLLIIQPSYLLEYHSENGNWLETPLPFEPRQAVFFADRKALITPERSLWILPGEGQSGTDEFGNGGLPFPPAQATALTSGPDHTILVGGPAGAVARYDFKSGSWPNLPSLPLWAGSVVQLENISNGLRARSSSGAVFRIDNVNDGQWTEEPDVRRWVIAPSGAQWTLTTTGVEVSHGPESETTRTFSEADGIQSFVARANYLWQPDPDRIVLIASGTLGEFDRRNDRWREVPGTLAEEPTRFIPVKNGLLMLEHEQIRLLTQDLEIKRAERRPACLNVNENSGFEQYLKKIESYLETLCRTLSNTAQPYSIQTLRILDMAVSANGDDYLWVLESGQAIEYRFTNDIVLLPTGRRVTVPATIDSLDIAAVQADDITLAPPRAAGASLVYDELILDWSLDPSRRVNAAWRNRPDLPVWGSCGDRLVVQCVHDIWIDTDQSEIVLATELGILRRSTKDYSVISVESGFRANLDDLRTTPPAVAQGIEWRLDGDGLSAWFGQEVLGWTQTGPDWRLNTDVIQGVRATGNTSLTLETLFGAWIWETDKGRTQSIAAPAPAELIIETPAIRISLNREEIQLAAFDGRPAFQNGRFFFDDISDIRGYRGALYSLVAGRAVMRRSGSALGYVEGAWTLPGSLGHVWSLSPSANGIRLAGSAGTYELAEARQPATWLAANPIFDDVSVGPMTWRRSVTGGWNVSYQGREGSWLVQPWWSRGRFSWDDYRAVGAMDNHRLALATPVGIAVHNFEDGLETLIQSQPFTSSSMARNGTRIVGTLFDGNWLLRSDQHGQPELRPASSGLDQSASTIFDRINHPQLGHVLAFREEWNETAASFLPLYSEVRAVATEALLHAGGFVFDAPSTAALLPGPRWFTVTGCGLPRGHLRE